MHVSYTDDILYLIYMLAQNQSDPPIPYHTHINYSRELSTTMDASEIYSSYYLFISHYQYFE